MSENKKRLLIVMGSMGRGGAERVISNISNYFSDKDWNVSIVLLLDSKVDYKLHENVEIINLSGKIRSRILRLPNWVFGLRKVVKKVNPDVVLSFVARINIITQIACKGLNKKIVISERNDPYKDGRSKIIDRLTFKLYPKASAVVFQTERARGYFEKIKLNNSLIISNPIAVNCYADEDKKMKIVNVGRLTQQKNQKMLISSFSKVLKVYPELSLEIYGEGDLRKELQKQINELKLENHVFLKGNVSNVHEKISDASIFVLSSDYEGLSNALLEAMMMGLPCISTNCAGADECIIDNENGVLVNVGNEEELTNAMIALLSDKDKANKISINAKKIKERVAMDIVMEQWYSVINS